MKNVLITGLLFVILFSCEKKDDLCESDSCRTYLKIWKELLISRNHLTEAYFDEHIFPYSSSIDTWNDGKSFRIEYRVKIDWAEAKLSDQFIIWLDPSTTGIFPSVPVPRSSFLLKDQISKLVDKFAFSSSIHEVAFIDQLKYSSSGEAIQELKTASGVENLNPGTVFYEDPGFKITPGHPFLRSGAEISRSENKCMSCQIDLVTGETEVRQEPCVIIIY